MASQPTRMASSKRARTGKTPRAYHRCELTGAGEEEHSSSTSRRAPSRRGVMTDIASTFGSAFFQVMSPQKSRKSLVGIPYVLSSYLTRLTCGARPLFFIIAGYCTWYER